MRTPVLLVLLALPCAAHAAFRDGPYLQALTPTGVTVIWRADPPAPGRVVVEGPGLPVGGLVITVPAEKLSRAVVTNLRPATRYRYTVEVAGARESGELATALPPGDGAAFMFVAYGDNGSAPDRHRQVIDQVVTEPVDFVVSTGDMVLDPADSAQWHRLLSVEGPLIRNVVVFPTIGNHDIRSNGVRVDTARSLFALPGRTTEGPFYYAFTHGRSRFVMLDTNEYGAALTAETAWLDRELAAARADPAIDHIFVVMHYPLFSVGLHGGKQVLRDAWHPLFARFRVTAVLSGHDHDYERAEVDGIRYFVSGGGGANTYARNRKPHPVDAAAVKQFEAVLHYLRISVHGDRIEVTAIRTDGTTIETTTWTDVRP